MMLRGLWKLTWIETQDLPARAAGRDRDDRYPGFDVPCGGSNGRPQSCADLTRGK